MEDSQKAGTAGTTATVAEPTTPVENQEPEIDYKAELEKTKERLKKAEFTLYKKNKEEKEEEENSDTGEDEIRRIANEEAERKFQSMITENSVDVVDELLDSLTSNAEERELIKLRYEKSIVKTGFTRVAIKNDLLDARDLVNAPRYRKTTAEIAETLKAKQSMSGAGLGTNLGRPSASEDLSKQFTAVEWAFMQRRGFTEEQIKKAISFKLNPNLKFNPTTYGKR